MSPATAQSSESSVLATPYALSAWVNRSHRSEEPGPLWAWQTRNRGEAAAALGWPWHLRRRAPLLPDGVKAVRHCQHDWSLLGPEAESALRAALRTRLLKDGFTPDLRDEALACVAAKAQRTLQRNPHDSQILCAQGLLDGLLVDMEGGEGKSLAVAMAAAACALAGAPVHILTAREHLASRDARGHAPLFSALGLRVAFITSRSTLPQRRAAYQADITYATPGEIAMDHLRDGLKPATEPADEAALPMLPRGLCCAILDDADSLLMDAAATPLVVSEPEDDRSFRDACELALALGRRVRLDVDAVLDISNASVHWTDVGSARMELLTARLEGDWLVRDQREALLAQALLALHVLHAGHDYAVSDGHIQPLDAPGGRTSHAVEWSRALRTLVALKENCAPETCMRTLAQTSLQRFFGCYPWLAGTGASLQSCRVELQKAHGLTVVRVSPRHSLRRIEAPARVFQAAGQRETAAVARIQELQAAGRPVLVGVASAQAARLLSAALRAHAVEHQVLDAEQDAQAAALLAAAGQAGAVTLATAQAGRGMPIELDAGVVEAGGLHVLDLLDTPCARTRRQFIGRAARQGEPGSAETWHAADSPCWDTSWVDIPSESAPQWMLKASTRIQHLSHDWAGRRQRLQHLKQEAPWPGATQAACR